MKIEHRLPDRPNGENDAGLFEGHAYSTEGKADSEITITVWPWVPQIEIRITRGKSFCVSGDECRTWLAAFRKMTEAIECPEVPA